MHFFDFEMYNEKIIYTFKKIGKSVLRKFYSIFEKSHDFEFKKVTAILELTKKN